MQSRDEAKIRKKLLQDCRRPAFARLARYTKEVDMASGETVTRASVKFVEAALVRWGNVRTENIITADTDKTRTVRVLMTDLQTGAEYSKEILLEKTVERMRLSLREKVLGTRRTAGGQVYLVQATEDDLASKEAALASIVVRQLGLRILPADLVAECMEEVAKTIEGLDPAGSSQQQPPVSQEIAHSSRSSALAGLLKQRKADCRGGGEKTARAAQAKNRRPGK